MRQRPGAADVKESGTRVNCNYILDLRRPATRSPWRRNVRMYFCCEQSVPKCVQVVTSVCRNNNYTVLGNGGADLSAGVTTGYHYLCKCDNYRGTLTSENRDAAYSFQMIHFRHHLTIV